MKSIDIEIKHKTLPIYFIQTEYTMHSTQHVMYILYITCDHRLNPNVTRCQYESSDNPVSAQIIMPSKIVGGGGLKNKMGYRSRGKFLS